MIAMPELLMLARELRIRMSRRKQIVLVNFGLLVAMILECHRGTSLREELWAGVIAFLSANLLLWLRFRRTRRSR